MLCDAPRLCGHYLAFPQTVQQRSLSVIHVTHDGDHGGAGLHVSRFCWRPVDVKSPQFVYIFVTGAKQVLQQLHVAQNS